MKSPVIVGHLEKSIDSMWRTWSEKYSNTSTPSYDILVKVLPSTMILNIIYSVHEGNKRNASFTIVMV